MTVRKMGCQKKKSAVLLADTRHALLGQMLIQLNQTNRELFDEAVIFDDGISQEDKNLMTGIMPCRFLPYSSPLEGKVPKTARMSRFSLLMFARYEMFRLLSEYQLLMWIDTDMVIQGSLSALLDSTEGYGFSILCEDPDNKSSRNVDYMRTNFFQPVADYRMDTYLYCTGLIIVRDCLKQFCDYTEWCYQKTIQWAENLNLPDQGVLNALIQTFKFPVKSLGDHGKYACYPYVGRDCSTAALVHSWGENKFWSDWYLNQKFPRWEACYQAWVALGGSPLLRKALPETSVIIPTYKPDLGYFKQCLDSLVTQEKSSYEAYSNFEIIIVSEPFDQENIASFVESYHDPRIQVYFNTERLGIAASLNRALDLANGEFIARMDDDDISAPSRLFRQAEYLKSHPDITLCTTDYLYFGDMNEGRVALEGEMSRAWSILTCPFDHPTILFRKAFFAENGLFYDEKRKYVEDWELWMRAFEKGMRVGSINEILFYHRWHNGSAGQTNSTVEIMQEIIKDNFKKLDVDILEEDIGMISPWSGKVVESAKYERLEAYFTSAVEHNYLLKKYDSFSLSRVFGMRLSEARSGVLNELFIPAPNNRNNEGMIYTPEARPKGAVEAKGCIAVVKRLLKPLYRPFRHRYEDRIINIQEVAWSAEGAAKRTEDALYAHVATQDANLEQITAALRTLQNDYKNLLNAVLAQSAQAEATRQELSSKVFEQAEDTRQMLSDKVFEQAEATRQELSSKVFEQAEDTRQMLSGKVFEQAEDTRQMLSGKVFEQAEATRQELSGKVFEQAEDTRQELSGKLFEQAEATRQEFSSKIFEQTDQITQGREETHRHIDFTYRDLMVAMEQQKAFLPKNSVTLVTEFPIAYESLDHLYPHGTIRDNTRYPRFVEKCEELLGRRKGIAFLDLGCSGGGMVLEAALRGHLSIGLEGSDCSLKEQRAEWRLLGDRLQTCDITKPFLLQKEDGSLQKFDIITAWEVLEHIAEKDLPQLFQNIKTHLAQDGYFIGSIANWDDIDPVSGVNWHVTVHPYDWWAERFQSAGFVVCSELLNTADLARGGFNPPHCYELPYPEIDVEKTFHIVVHNGG